jgi:hypothetical protein
MPVMWVPFDRLAIGTADFGYGGMAKADNVYPAIGGGFRGCLPVGTAVATSNAGPDGTGAPKVLSGSVINGIHSHLRFYNTGGTTYQTVESVFFGSPRGLYYVDAFASDWYDATNVTDDTGYGSGGTTGVAARSWKFLSWGDKVLATNYSNPVQRFTFSAATFRNCITSAAVPRARFISSLGQHVVLANIFLPSAFESLSSGVNSQLVWWSKTDDEQTFSSSASAPADNSDYQPLADTLGPITALAKVGEESILFFKPTSVTLMSRTGGPDLYSFQVLHNGVGCVDPSSVVVVDRDVYFLAPHGRFCVMRNLGAPEPIDEEGLGFALRSPFSASPGEEGIERQSLVPPYSTTCEAVRAWYSQQMGVIHWYYEGASGNTFALQYHVPTGRWSSASNPSDLAVGLGVLACAPRTHAESSVASFASNYLPPTDGYLGVLDDLYHSHKVSGSPSSDAPTLVTKWLSLTPHDPTALGLGASAAEIFRVRPIFRRSTNLSIPTPATPTITITSALDPHGMIQPTTTALSTTADDEGFYTVTGGKLVGHFFRFQVELASVTAQLTDHILGLQVEASPDGAR